LSGQLIRWCCIDRLSWHRLSEVISAVGIDSGRITGYSEVELRTTTGAIRWLLRTLGDEAGLGSINGQMVRRHRSG
jgi:hypothetical protein